MSDYKISCCSHYNGTNKYIEGYVILPCFKVIVCEDCGNVEMVCNDKLTWLFEHIFVYFWTGKVTLKELEEGKGNGK